MSFINKLKAFFFNEPQVAIINIGNLIQIPGREYFKDNKKYLDLIDNYKKECLKILSQKKTILTKDISSNELINKKDMYINLVLNIVMKEDYYTYESQDLLDNKITLLKLKLYQEGINKIENDVIARLIALSELDNSRRVPIRNRNTIKNEIENLKISLYTLISQKISINKEIDNYLTHISISDNRMYPSKIEERRDQTIKYASYFMNINEIFNNEELTNNNIYKQMAIIALLETKIEEYLYLNKPSIEYLNNKADSIKKITNLNYNEARTIKSKLIEDIYELEDQYMIYYKFGKNLVKYDDWYRLYSAKFRILTFDIFDIDNYEDYNLNKLIFESRNDIERKIYASIISDKEFDIASGKNAVINYIHDFYIVKEGNTRIVQNLKKLLNIIFEKEDIEFTDTKEFHIRTHALRLLLSLDSKEDFCRFMNRKINIHNLPYFTNFNIFRHDEKGNFIFDDNIPLSTILEIVYGDVSPNYYRCLKELYSIHKKMFGNYFFMQDDIFKKIPNEFSFNDVYFLPEGINEIFLSLEHRKFDYYAKRVIEESKGKIIIMPKSLKEIYGELFESKNIKGIILNDGLEKIRYAYLKPSSKVIDIPSSLKLCNEEWIYNVRNNGLETDIISIDTLRFKDYKNSKLLNNSEKLYEFLCFALSCKTMNFKNHRTTVTLTSIKGKIDADIKVIPTNLKFIVLEENGEEVIKINLNDIHCYGTLTAIYKDDFYPITKELGKRYTEELIKHIKIEEIKLNHKQKVLKKIK